MKSGISKDFRKIITGAKMIKTVPPESCSKFPMTIWTSIPSLSANQKRPSLLYPAIALTSVGRRASVPNSEGSSLNDPIDYSGISYKVKLLSY
jgi:hypothetical protein